MLLLCLGDDEKDDLAMIRMYLRGIARNGSDVGDLLVLAHSATITQLGPPKLIVSPSPYDATKPVDNGTGSAINLRLACF